MKKFLNHFQEKSSNKIRKEIKNSQVLKILNLPSVGDSSEHLELLKSNYQNLLII